MIGAKILANPGLMDARAAFFYNLPGLPSFLPLFIRFFHIINAF